MDDNKNLKNVPEFNYDEIVKNVKEIENNGKEILNASNDNSKRKNLIYIIIFGILLLSILFSASYAYFSVDTTNTNKLGNITSTIDCIGVIYSETNTISLENTYPVTDEYALANYTPVTITVTNNCSAQLFYYFTITSLSNATGYIPDNKVSLALDKKNNNSAFSREQNPKFVSYLNKVPSSDILNTTLLADLNRRPETSSYTNKNNYVLDHDSILQGQTKTYKLYMWVDYYEGDVTHTGLNNNTTQGLDYKASLGFIPVNQPRLAKTVKYTYSDNVTEYQNSSDFKIRNIVRDVTDECSASGCFTVSNGNFYVIKSNDLNNVVFGGLCWKMIRTTLLGGVKLLYNGVVTQSGDNYTCGGDNKAINNDTAYVFNTTGVATANMQTPAAAGYMWNATTGTLQDMLQADDVNKYDSEVKTIVETWFRNWVNNNNVDTDKLEAAVYCNDRTLGTQDGGGYSPASLTDTLASLTSEKSYVFKSFHVNNDRSHQTQKIRPVITVNSTVYITKGDGSAGNPFVLN